MTRGPRQYECTGQEKKAAPQKQNQACTFTRRTSRGSSPATVEGSRAVEGNGFQLHVNAPAVAQIKCAVSKAGHKECVQCFRLCEVKKVGPADQWGV